MNNQKIIEKFFSKLQYEKNGIWYRVINLSGVEQNLSPFTAILTPEALRIWVEEALNEARREGYEEGCKFIDGQKRV